MIKIEKTETYGWDAAIRGMRNPMNSWEQSDTEFEYAYGALHTVKVGEKDYDLMGRLRNAGTDHRKFMRMITVSCDVEAPLYWWKEYDTYKVGTVANSCSTMHKIHERAFTINDFSCEYLEDDFLHGLRDIIALLNNARRMFLLARQEEEPLVPAKVYWWQMIQLLPSSYNQRRTVMLNYEVLANIYRSRRNHKLDEWHTFCEWIEGLPYSELITGVK